MDLLTRFPDATSAPDATREQAATLLRLLTETTGMEAAYLTEVDLEKDRQRLIYVHNDGTLPLVEGSVLCWRDTLCRRALEERSAYVLDAGERWQDHPLVRRHGVGSFLSVPIFDEDDLVGTLCGVSVKVVPPAPALAWAPPALAALVRQQAEYERLLEQCRRVNQELEASVFKDPLTGLPNRRYVIEELARMLAWTERDGIALLVGFVDLDGFKQINDGYGHETGDQLLVAMGERLRTLLRSSDMVGRFGGDEFVVMATVPRQQAAERCLGLQATLHARTAGDIELEAGTLRYQGASVGMVVARPGETPFDVLKRADLAMYHAKRLRVAR